ncbi:TPA: hypothetical protein ACH9QY_003471 [Escherichia coli]|uniref:hypothetical protein n=1 Tax=Escherichia coli TaxID=562 RepID=UPI0010AADC5B|nr:hypothetical protein [Escherichia coli]EFL9858780.1 hypothetical protein [Escherichia coli]ELW7845826.1 hypothetical protein [Escherichia coli]EMC5443749.1 hypothetical protein [Escherichia coli]MDN1388808.1 hypothetical protein [Escherichia coli]MDN1507550.1 hypothetical protein [Escherichia coli]
MSTITREWLQQAINDYESVRDELPFGLDDYQGNILAALRIALASLEAEPICFRCRRNDNIGDWSYVYHREPDDFERKHLVIEGIYAAPPAPVVPEGLIKAVRFYEQVKRENPPVETGAWKDAVDWVLKEACQAVNIGIKGE